MVQRVHGDWPPLRTPGVSGGSNCKDIEARAARAAQDRQGGKTASLHAIGRRRRHAMMLWMLRVSTCLSVVSVSSRLCHHFSKKFSAMILQARSTRAGSRAPCPWCMCSAGSRCGADPQAAPQLEPLACAGAKRVPCWKHGTLATQGSFLNTPTTLVGQHTSERPQEHRHVHSTPPRTGTRVTTAGRCWAASSAAARAGSHTSCPGEAWPRGRGRRGRSRRQRLHAAALVRSPGPNSARQQACSTERGHAAVGQRQRERRLTITSSGFGASVTSALMKRM